MPRFLFSFSVWLFQIPGTVTLAHFTKQLKNRPAKRLYCTKYKLISAATQADSSLRVRQQLVTSLLNGKISDQ